MRLKTGLGETLRSKREELGYSYEDIENETKIRVKFIEALENEDYKTIPGEVYVKGFLKAYADLLGLAGEELLAAYKGETSSESESAETIKPDNIPDSEKYTDSLGRSANKIPEKQSENEVRFSTRVGGSFEPEEKQKKIKEMEFSEAKKKRPSAEYRTDSIKNSNSMNANRRVKEKPKKHKSSFIMAVILFIAIGGTGYLSWNYMARNNDNVASVPEDTVQTPPQKHIKKATNTPTGVQVGDKTTAGNTSQSAVTGSVTSGASVQTPGQMQMTLKIEGSPCWVSVKADGQTVVNKTLEAGSEVNWTVNEVANVKLGNAGAAKIMINGTDIGKLGENGSIYKKEFRTNAGGAN